MSNMRLVCNGIFNAQDKVERRGLRRQGKSQFMKIAICERSMSARGIGVQRKQGKVIHVRRKPHKLHAGNKVNPSQIVRWYQKREGRWAA